MKTYFIFILLGVASCKPVQPLDKDVGLENETPVCVLPFFPKTIDYKNQMDKYLSTYKDTIFEIEAKELGTHQYRTILELGMEEYYLWLLTKENQNIDSLLIHCITPTKSVDAEFDFKTCRIELEANEYDQIGNPISGSTYFVSMQQ